GERAIKRGEAQIVADRQSEPPPRQVGRHADFTRPVVARLAITLAAAEFDVEHVNLVIARDDVALAVDQERTVRRLFGQQLDGERPDMQEDAELARKLAKGGKRSVFLLGRDRREQPLALDLQDVGHLGCEHVVGAGARGFLDQPHRRVEISLRRQARAHRPETWGEGRSLAWAQADGLLPAPAGASPRSSSGSSLPAWSSAERSS